MGYSGTSSSSPMEEAGSSTYASEPDCGVPGSISLQTRELFAAFSIGILDAPASFVRGKMTTSTSYKVGFQYTSAIALRDYCLA